MRITLLCKKKTLKVQWVQCKLIEKFGVPPKNSSEIDVKFEGRLKLPTTSPDDTMVIK